MSSSINTGTDIKNLSANTAYTFYVYPINSNGQESTTAQTVSFTTLPSLTTYFLSSVDSYSQITVGWTGSYSSVAVYYSTSIDTGYTLYDTPTSSSKSVQNLSANTQYYFKLIPYNSNSVAGTTQYISDTNAVTKGYISSFSTASATSYSEISLTYYGIFSSAIIYYGTTSGSTTYSTTISTPSTSIDTAVTTAIPSLTANQTYYFKIYPYNSIGTVGTASSEKNTVTLGYISSVSTSDVTSLSIKLTYYGVFSSVIIYYGTTSGSTTNSTTVSTVSTSVSTENTTTISGLSSSQIYYFTIYPYNSSGTVGSASSEVNATTSESAYGYNVIDTTYLKIYLPLSADTSNYATGSAADLGTVTNGASLSTTNNSGSYNTGSMYFNNKTLQYTNFTSIDMSTTTSYTISYWIYMPSPDTGYGLFRMSNASIASGNNNGTNVYSSQTMYMSNEQQNNKYYNRMQIYTQKSDNSSTNYQGMYIFNRSSPAWTHIAISYTYSTTSPSFNVYVNGVQNSNVSNTANSYRAIGHSISYIIFGQGQDVGNTSNYYLSNFRLYNTDLTSSQISVLYSNKV